MMKQELEELLGYPVLQEKYEKIEEVYMWHPSIESKEQMAELYDRYGIRLICDMLPRARRIKDLENKLLILQLECRELQEEINKEKAV